MESATAAVRIYCYLVVVACCFSLQPGTAKQMTSENWVVFGDSMSDNGTGAYPYITSYLAQMISMNISLLYPIAYPAAEGFQYALGTNNQLPYYRHASTNGPVWPSYLAPRFGASVENNAVSGSVTGATNLTLQGVPNICGLAFISYPNGSNIIPGLDNLIIPLISTPVPLPTFLDQVSSYISRQNAPISASTIFFLDIGGNDVNSFVLLNRSAAEIPAFSEGLKRAYTEALGSLYAIGGRKFIVFDMGDIANIPYIAHNYSPAQRAMIKRAQAAGEREIAKTLSDFASSHTDAKVVTFPLSAVVANISSDSVDGGFAEVTSQCYNNTSPAFTQPSFICQNPTAVVCQEPGGFLFWDGYHFTTAGHRAIAEALVPYVAGVREVHT
eukprot:jgi/Botrbrau1/12891/Bobra.0299s0011.1